MEPVARRLRRCSRRSGLTRSHPGLADSASTHLWVLPGACFPPISRLRRCCARAATGYARPASNSMSDIGGLAGTSRGHCHLPHRGGLILSRPRRSCWRSAAAVGPSSFLMRRGCRCWQDAGIHIVPLQPANCGFDVGWSEHFRTKFAGHPVKSVAIIVRNTAVSESWHPGEFVITETGVEGGVIYAVSASLRDEILAKGVAILRLDLAPDRDMPRLTHDLSRSRGKRTMATHLQRRRISKV